MSDKKITELQLRSNCNDDVNFPVDDGIQTYRNTATQVATYVLAKPVAVVYKTANYTAAPANHVISCDASGGDFTISLPTAVGIEGKIFKIKRTDTDATKFLTVDANSTELIDGDLTISLNIGESLTLVSDNVGWQILDYKETFGSEVSVSDTTGYGSTNTKIRRFTNVDLSLGADITYLPDASLGDRFRANKKGRYAITYVDYAAGTGGKAAGISVNTTAPTTNIGSLTYADGLRGCSYATTGDITRAFSTVLNLDKNDLVYPHSYGDFDNASGALQMFRMTRVS